MKQDWEVEPAKGRCAVTGRSIEEGAEFYTVLFEDGESFRRVDYSLEAWTGPPEGSYCHFKTRVPVKQKRKKLLVDNDSLMSLFARLAAETEPLRIQFRFVLALILMRKRILRYEGSQMDDDVEVWRMVQPGCDDEHKVIHPPLTDQEIEAVSGQLSAVLHGDMGEWAAHALPLNPIEATDAEPSAHG